MSSFQKILAIDIGAGTQDILLYNASLTPENCTSMILPSPTKRYVQYIERADSDLYISGDTIGGGDIAAALLRHRQKGFRVMMTVDAAYTLCNKLDQISDYGISIDDTLSAHENRTGALHLCEFDWPYIKQFLSLMGESGDVDAVAIAVQDHGVPPSHISNRSFRFMQIASHLQHKRNIASFAYSSDVVPSVHKRMRAIAARAQLMCNCPVIVMDTCFAAIMGCLEESKTAIVVNVGNSHTVVAVLQDGTLSGLLEHHTARLSAEKIDMFIHRLVGGDITSDEVFDDGGHGAIVLDNGIGKWDWNEPIIVTGPKRNLLRESKLRIQFAAPYGNMMLMGPFGLVAALRFVYELQQDKP